MAEDEVDEVEAEALLSEPSTACIRYLRLRVFFWFGPSFRPQKYLLETT